MSASRERNGQYMDIAEKTKILLKLDKDWLAKQSKSEISPIGAIIRDIKEKAPEIVAVAQDENSCTFELSGKPVKAEELHAKISGIVNEALGVSHKDTAYDVQILGDGLVGAWQVWIEFEDSWVLERRGDDVLPVDNFAGKLTAELEGLGGTVQKGSCTLTRCLLTVDGVAQEAVQAKTTLVLEMMGAQNSIVRNTVEPKPLETKKSEEQKTDADTVGESSDGDGGTPKLLTLIDNLIGVDSFKELAHEVAAIAPQILKHKTLDSFLRRTYLFSIGDGCGLTTQLFHFAALLDELGLTSIGDKVLECPAEMKLNEMLERTAGYLSGNRIISFDISQWMDKTKQPEFRTFLKHLSTMNGKQIFVFRIPFVDEHTRRKMLTDISDMLTIRDVTTNPYTMEHLVEFSTRLLDMKGFTLEEESREKLEERLVEEKSDGHFYGFSTARKIVDEILYQKHVADSASDGEEDTIVRGDDIPRSSMALMGVRSAMEQLNELIGMDKIKERIDEILAQIEATKAAVGDMEPPALHMCFVGNPGTGKTTVARILGQLMKERGLLSKGQFFEYGGRDFCGQYIGETAPKTAAMCRDAYGSVLFIDEAYSLYRGGGDTKDYGREALDTLIAQMENHRHDFMVIMAGYTDDMRTLMEGNAGLASRIPYTIEFNNYNRDELFKIFMLMAGRSFSYEPELEIVVKSYFDSLSDNTIMSKDFANARFVRNLFERTWGKASIRTRMTGESFVLRAVDFDKASAEREFQDLQEKKRKRIGF